MACTASTQRQRNSSAGHVHSQAQDGNISPLTASAPPPLHPPPLHSPPPLAASPLAASPLAASHGCRIHSVRQHIALDPSASSLRSPLIVCAGPRSFIRPPRYIMRRSTSFPEGIQPARRQLVSRAMDPPTHQTHTYYRTRAGIQPHSTCFDSIHPPHRARPPSDSCSVDLERSLHLGVRVVPSTLDVDFDLCNGHIRSQLAPPRLPRARPWPRISFVPLWRPEQPAGVS